MIGSGESLLVNTDRGLYCPSGDFYIDPWKPVPRALITHAHSDHARSGSKSYLSSEQGRYVLRGRLGKKASIQSVPYGEQLSIGSVRVSFHSAGHVLGSAQIRLEENGCVWVVSGDYKTRKDPTCAPFELLKCHCFITESTFGLPVFRWMEPELVANELNAWWDLNRQNKKVSVVYAYSFGKAQRVLSMADPGIGPIFVHGAVANMNAQYRASGVKLPDCRELSELLVQPLFAAQQRKELEGALLLLPPGGNDEVCAGLGLDVVSAFASGWMRIRANRRGQSVDRGFVLSDHADWDELLHVIQATAAERVIVTHGYSKQLIRYLNELGISASSFRTGYADPESELLERTAGDELRSQLSSTPDLLN